MPTSEKNRDLLIWCAIWLFVLSLVVGGVALNSLGNSHAIDDLRDEVVKLRRSAARIEIAASKAQTAAQRASDDLTYVLTLVNSPEAQAAAQRSRARLERVEYALCGGPCPPVPTTTTTIPATTTTAANRGD